MKRKQKYNMIKRIPFEVPELQSFEISLASCSLSSSSVIEQEGVKFSQIVIMQRHMPPQGDLVKRLCVSNAHGKDSF